MARLLVETVSAGLAGGAESFRDIINNRT